MTVDHERMKAAVHAFLEAMGLDVAGPDLGRTPERVARAWNEDLASGYHQDPDTVLSWTPVEAGSGVVLVRGISLASICIHHLLPFQGAAHVAYLPGTRQAGLSKIGRVVDAHARRLQTQEQLGRDVVATLDRVLEPRGTLVVLEAEHTCMTLRGVRKEQSRMMTVATSGVYHGDGSARAEVLQLLGVGRGQPG